MERRPRQRIQEPPDRYLAAVATITVGCGNPGVACELEVRSSLGFGALTLFVHGEALWVPVIRSKSCGLRVLMDQPTESISSHDPPSRHGDS